jgi:hypothetical protein
MTYHRHHKHHYTFRNFVKDTEHYLKPVTGVINTAVHETGSTIRNAQNVTGKIITTGENAIGKTTQSITQFIPFIVLGGVAYLIITSRR